MRTKLTVLAFTLLSTMGAWAQSKYNLSGMVIEKGSNEAVMSATVQVCTVKDTAFVAGAATDPKGQFLIKDVKKGSYLVKVTFIGYQPHVLPLTLGSQKDKTIDLGYITLSDDAHMLKEAVVTANAAKVQVSGDSLVYNASAYRMPEGSALEDLVKKLPGATIDDNGTIKINGKEVSKILVDGKEFFINDKNIALKNLPTNIIDKIKTYDRKSDLARVTGIDDGEEETVLDLTVKKGMNNGWFGQINLGAGTEKRYNERANVNRFNGNNQFSVVLGANNVGDRGFGGGGGRGWGFGGGNGLRASKEVGFNYATTSDKLETGGYIWHRYDGSDSWNRSHTQNFVTPTGAFSNSTNQNFTSNASLTAGFRFEWKPDSMTNVIFRPNANYSRNRGNSWSASGSYDEDPENYDEKLMDKAEYAFMNDITITDPEISQLAAAIVNTNKSRQQTYSNNKGLNGELQFNRRLSANGRNLTIRATGGISDSESKQLSASNIHYRNGVSEPNINNRYYTTPGESNNWSAQLTYSEPIAPRTYLQFSYRFNYRYNKSDRDAFTYDPVAYNDIVSALNGNRYDVAGAVNDLMKLGYQGTLDDHLSQFSEYRNLDHTISVMLRVTRDAYNLNVGMDFLPQHSELKYEYMGTNYPKVKRDVFNFTPTANLRYKFNDTSNLQFTYRGRTTQPSMTNLLDITDDSNPLNITKGNPGLKPSFNSNIRLFYNTYMVEHQTGIFANVMFNTTQNDIANRTSYDAQTGVRTTKPENINGNWNGNLGLGFNTAIGESNAFTLNNFVNLGYQNHVSYLDPLQYTQDKSTTKTTNVSDRLSMGYRNDWLDVSLNGSLTYNHSDNNVLKNGKQNTYQFSYGTEVNITAPWGTQISTDLAMNSRRGYSQSNMNTNELLWNAQVSQSFLKGNALTISLSWNDILQKQSNISRTINAMMRSDSRYNAIYSYGMVKVIYKLNIFGGKNANGTSNERDAWGNPRGQQTQGGRPGGSPGGRPGGFGGGRPPMR